MRGYSEDKRNFYADKEGIFLDKLKSAVSPVQGNHSHNFGLDRLGG